MKIPEYGSKKSVIIQIGSQIVASDNYVDVLNVSTCFALLIKDPCFAVAVGLTTIAGVGMDN